MTSQERRRAAGRRAESRGALRLATAVAGVATAVAIIRRSSDRPRFVATAMARAPAIQRLRRRSRNVEVARLSAAVGRTYVTSGARKLFASAERRIEIDEERRLRTAEQVAERLGNMKGALMKVGQMASYLDDGLPEPVRAALAQLQTDAPPMTADLAAEVVERELGTPPEKLFTEWDPEPIAAASIGQVHRAVATDPATGREHAVAVKVQYPGVDEAIAADLRNLGMLGALLQQGFTGLDPDDMVTEIKERLTEEIDYEREARNQQLFADYYRSHPFIHVPDVLPAFSTRRVLTTELVTGATWRDALMWAQHERDLAAECLFRFVFRSLYRMRAFNGDPHPGNYLFHGGGRVTFLDFGLVKHFSAREIRTFADMVRAAAVDHDPQEFRRLVEQGGLLHPDAPVSTPDVMEYYSQFYAPVSTDGVMTWTKEYASSIVRHTFDRTSPIAQHSTVPRSFVFIQRINLGLYALLGDLGAVGNYRKLAEEIWPFVDRAPSTPMGEAEAAWLA